MGDVVPLRRPEPEPLKSSDPLEVQKALLKLLREKES